MAVDLVHGIDDFPAAGKTPRPVDVILNIILIILDFESIELIFRDDDIIYLDFRRTASYFFIAGRAIQLKSVIFQMDDGGCKRAYH